MDLIIPNWHPTLVHFTIALLTVAAVFFIGAVFISNADIRRRALLVAEWNFWVGAAVTVLTLLAGWRAFNTVAHDDPAHEMMIRHRNLALITAGWVLLAVAWLVLRRRAGRDPFGPVLGAAALVLLGLLAVTGWHGGELVYRHGLGVMSLPDTGAYEHGDDGHGGHEHTH